MILYLTATIGNKTVAVIEIKVAGDKKKDKSIVIIVNREDIT